MTCKDPLTNQVIVGEVDFFELELEQILGTTGQKPEIEPNTALTLGLGTPVPLVHRDSLK